MESKIESFRLDIIYLPYVPIKTFNWHLQQTPVFISIFWKCFPNRNGKESLPNFSRIFILSFFHLSRFRPRFFIKPVDEIGFWYANFTKKRSFRKISPYTTVFFGILSLCEKLVK